MKTEIKKRYGKNCIVVSYKGQSFTLLFDGESDEELEHHRDMFDLMVSFYTQDVINELKKNKK